MTTITQAQLVAPMQLANADAGVYTPPALTTSRVGRAVFCNTTADATTITAGLTTGGALTAGTTLLSARTIAPGESYTSPELAGLAIPFGSSLRAFAGAATAVTFEASGLLFQ